MRLTHTEYLSTQLRLKIFRLCECLSCKQTDRHTDRKGVWVVIRTLSKKGHENVSLVSGA